MWKKLFILTVVAIIASSVDSQSGSPPPPTGSSPLPSGSTNKINSGVSGSTTKKSNSTGTSPASGTPPMGSSPASGTPSAPASGSTGIKTDASTTTTKNSSSNTATATTASTTTKSSTSLNPIITNWITTVATGYKGYQANVLKIYYDSSNVYIASNSIPSYSIGTWDKNPNDAKPQNWTLALPLTPKTSTTKRETMMGVIGLWKNGVGIYNAKDGYSYNNQSVWNRNAAYWEAISFDLANGHPDGSGTYHCHLNPVKMYNSSSSVHSEIIGWAWDGYPIYGPFGYSSANNTSSSIKRIMSSYKLRDITVRTSLANGTVLSSTYYGPDISSTYPLGSYLEDYEYSAGYGDTDEYGGRYCVTPEYPSGTYAYFIPTNSSGASVYPYTIGPYFKGSVSTNGPSALHASIPNSATKYFSYI